MNDDPRDGQDYTPIMSTERPLDALLPELGEATAPLDATPMHQRVLEVELEDGFEWVFACWRDPGGITEFNAHLRNLVEAALLAHLSQPARMGRVLERRYSGLRLFCFDHVKGPLSTAVRSFGFTACPFEPEKTVARMGALAEEAQRMGWTLPKTPRSLWHAPIQRPDDEFGEQLDEIHDLLVTQTGEEVWGERPGRPSKLMAAAFEEYFKVDITPDLDGLRTMELLLIQKDAGPIRWLSPLFFQGLCDFVGVLLSALWAYPVQWSLCEQDAVGLYPPPHFRIPTEEGRHEHLLIGLQILRWCVMPIQPDEEVPLLSDWLRGTFGRAMTV